MEEKKKFTEPKFNYDFTDKIEPETIYTKKETMDEMKKLVEELHNGTASEESIKKLQEIQEGLINEHNILKQKEKELVRQALLLKYTNFDHSDIRLNTQEFYFIDGGCALARCHDDHIEFITKSWISEFKFFENIMHSLNHEHIHAVVDRILLEDDFEIRGKYDMEWMFYAGGLDDLFGINSSLTAPIYYLSVDAIRNTVIMNNQKKSNPVHSKKWDYDI